MTLTEKPDALTEVQTVDVLRACLSEMQTATVFKTYDVLAHRFPAHAQLTGATAPHIFVEYLAEPIKAFSTVSNPHAYSTNVAAWVYDCRIACIANGKHYVAYLMDSRMFKHHPDYPSQ